MGELTFQNLLMNTKCEMMLEKRTVIVFATKIDTHVDHTSDSKASVTNLLLAKRH